MYKSNKEIRDEAKLDFIEVTHLLNMSEEVKGDGEVAIDEANENFGHAS